MRLMDATNQTDLRNLESASVLPLDPVVPRIEPESRINDSINRSPRIERISRTTLAEEAFRELFPEKELPHLRITYSGKFKSYNANIRYRGNNFTFGLARDWKDVDDVIVKGLLQHLLLRVFRSRVSRSRNGQTHETLSIELYNAFMRHLHKSVKKDKSDPILDLSFARMNDRFLEGSLEIANLEWGSYSKALLGNYNYHTDTIRISQHFREGPQELLDYIMYHEMLHKKLKFTNSGSSCRHHTSEFREWERRYPNIKTMDAQIRAHLRYKRNPEKKRIDGRDRKRGFLWRWF